MHKRLFALLMFAAFLSTPAFAKGLKEGTVELGPYVGYAFPDGYGGADPKNDLLYGVRIGAFLTPNVSFEPSFQAFFTETNMATAPQHIGFRNYSLRFNLLYNFLPDGPVVPFITGGLGWEALRVNGAPKSDDLGFNAGAGLRWLFAESFAARLDGRFIYTEVGGAIADHQFNFEGALGVSYLFGGKPPLDTDGDGVIDKNDTCPGTPKGATVDHKGCPADSDGDGVFDGIDQCAGTPKGAKVDEKGCPVDSDGDGVFDGLDQCANTPKDTKVDLNGCPLVLDADGDGVADDVDKCPNTPKDTKVDATGCPIVLDADGDGVADNLDKCPNTPKDTKVDATGCPTVSKARGVLKGVNFMFGKAQLKPESFKVLDEAAAALQEFPEVLVEVQGHTDSSGPEASNLKLSQARAQSVTDYLVSKGVNKNRLHSKGYGGSKPIADNKTKAGRMENRRVELLWLDAAPKAP